MARWTVESRANHGIQIKICDTMFLYFKERWITMISTRLLEIELVHNQEQDTAIFNKRGYQQIKEGKVFQ